MKMTTKEAEERQAMVEDQSLARIEAMMHQETKFYSCHDYCQMYKDSQNCQSLQEDRKLMLQWSYNLVDFFNLERETAGIALSYSDRFLQSKERGREFLDDTQKYQLLCIASLYVAIKIHEPASLTPQAFVEISRHQYTVQEMEQMEKLLLNTLEWRVNPPTSLEFVRHYLDLIPMCQLDKGLKATAYVLARAQTERAHSDYSLLTVEASKIAFACVQNSLEALGRGNSHGLYTLASRIQRDYFHFELDELRRRLYSAIMWESSTIAVATGGKHSQGAPSSYGSGIKGSATHKYHLENTTPRSVATFTS